jgi:hypothetical protein
VTTGARNRDRRVGGMSTRAAAWSAWSAWAICAALAALAVVLDFYTPPVPARHGPNFEVLAGVPLLVYPTVGAFVASRRPKNAVGWVLCGMGLVFELSAFAGAYADYALFAHPGSLPAGETMLWVPEWVLFEGTTLGVTLLVLLFPDGRPPTRNWWAVAWMAVGGAALWSLWWGTWAQPSYLYPSIHNPLGIGGVLGAVLEALGRVGAAILLLSCILSLISVFLRLDGAGVEERQQLKWFAYAAAVLLGDFCFAVLPANQAARPWVAFVFVVGGLLGIPVAVGIAVLKYRLYDIDRLINRTLVYGALTAALVAAYFGGVVGLQWVLRALTGGSSQLAVVASTLAIAALFDPLRRSTQAFVDRLFYRRKYDAAKTLAAFTSRLRDETALDALSEDLVGVVRETMQPAHVSLWLRPGPSPKESEGGPEQPQG